MTDNIDKKYNFPVFIVRSMRLCAWLLNHKFPMIRSEQNRDFPEKLVFHFTNSKDLISCINEYKLMRAEEKVIG
ncbi:hypothetical protein [Desulfosporosinus fructosivorans]